MNYTLLLLALISEEFLHGSVKVKQPPPQSLRLQLVLIRQLVAADTYTPLLMGKVYLDMWVMPAPRSSSPGKDQGQSLPLPPFLPLCYSSSASS